MMTPETEEVSETERIARELRSFRPRQAVRMLRDDKEPAFLKTWALARLLGWSLLDQRPGKRRPKTQRGDVKYRPKLRIANAKRIGDLTLAYLLDQKGPKKNDETFQQMLAVFLARGGFAVYLKGRGVRELLSQAREDSRELGYVYRIVLFLCRYKKYIGDDARFDIDSAKRFVEMDAHEDRDTYGLSKISKIWEKYKQAAPYIFAFYRFFSSTLARMKSSEQVVDFLQKLTAKQDRLARVLGRAAYAADVLSKRARDVRLRDFKQVTRVEPPLRPFGPDELHIIEGIDRTSAIA